MVLIFDPITSEVKNIKIIGARLIKAKKSNLLSFKFNLKLNFLTKRKIKRKKGISIPICLNKKESGYWI